jgi:hypothetical protein
VRGFARLLGNDQTVINSELPFAFVGNATFLGIPLLVLIAAAVVLASWFVLRRTVFGIHVYSVGGNPSGARLAGIRVWAVLLLVYSISGLCAGAGWSDVGRPSLRGQRHPARAILRARRHRCRDPRWNQLRRRNWLDLGQPSWGRSSSPS